MNPVITMFPLKPVQCGVIYYVIVILCQICHTRRVNNVLSDEKVDGTEIDLSLELPDIDVSKEWGKNHVEFVTENSVKETEAEIYYKSVIFRHWMPKSRNNNGKFPNFNQPSSQKRTSRQTNTGYTHLYPTLPTTGAYGNHGLYNFNNVTNKYPYGQSPSPGSNIAIPIRYDYSNFTRSGQSNLTLSNPYQYNSQQVMRNGINSYPNQYNSTFVKPGTIDSINIYNYPTTNLSQPTSRPFYPGGTNNRTNFVYPQPNSTPLYPGTTKYGTNPSYPHSHNGTFTQIPTNNQTFSRYPQPTNKPFYPGVTNNSRNLNYPQTTSGSLYPGAVNSGTNPSYPQPGGKPYYPGAVYNNTRPSYTQSTSRPGSTNNGMYPSYSVSYNSNNRNNPVPPLNNSRPSYNLTSISPYNPQIRYPTFNPNSSSQAAVSGLRPSYNVSESYGSRNSESQGYGSSLLNNFPQAYNSTYSANHSSNYNWRNPQYRPYNNYTNSNIPSPDAQYFVPNTPYSNNNNANYPLNQYNAASEHNNFFYQQPKSGPIYDPRKNPPNQFSYNQ